MKNYKTTGNYFKNESESDYPEKQKDEYSVIDELILEKQEEKHPFYIKKYNHTLRLATTEEITEHKQKGDPIIKNGVLKGYYKQQKESWQERFDKIMDEFWDEEERHYWLEGRNVNDIKQFITELLDNQRQEIVKKIEKRKVELMGNGGALGTPTIHIVAELENIIN